MDGKKEEKKKEYKCSVEYFGEMNDQLVHHAFEEKQKSHQVGDNAF